MSDYLTLPEVAATLRCSERYAADLMRAGTLTASKVGGKWVTTGEHIAAYVARQSNNRRRRRRGVAA